MGSSNRAVDLGDPSTPMAWQQRDLNYHQSGYQDRYGPGATSSHMAPPSTSDRLSHRTDKSWRTQRDSRDSGQPHSAPYGAYSQASQYPPSRPSYSSGRPASHVQSPSGSSSSSSSTSTEVESEQVEVMGPMGAMPPPHPIYGYAGYYQGYPPMPGMQPNFPGTLKSARSVPALSMAATWDGEPCPVHHGMGPMSLPPGANPYMAPPGYMLPPQGGPMSLPPPQSRRVNSIYDMRISSPHPPPPVPIYGTLPARPVPMDRRSMPPGSTMGSVIPSGPPPGIPPHLLPPMARPRPLVVGEGGNAEPLPVRSPDKRGTLTAGLPSKGSNGSDENGSEVARVRLVCMKGAGCVAWVILAVVCLGILLGVMLRFIL